jgi:uncharacterized glyoxalase superfamily protein PhnB
VTLGNFRFVQDLGTSVIDDVPMNSPSSIRVTTIPAIRYADPDRAIEWLKTALGFTESAVYRNPTGVVEHAELVLGNGMVMIGTAGHNQQSAHWFAQPHSVSAVTASVYLVVPDCGPVYASAKAVGAEILQEMETKSYGGSSFIVRDPEGQIWSLGEYNPWSKETKA